MKAGIGEDLMAFSQMIKIAGQTDLPIPKSLLDLTQKLEEGNVKNWGSIVSSRLESGHSLSEAVSGLEGMDPLLSALLSVPDGKGLGNVLGSYSRFQMASQELRERLNTVLFYPVLILLLVFLNFAQMNFYLFPAMEEAFGMKQKNLPEFINLFYVASPATRPLSVIFSGILFSLPIVCFWLLLSQNFRSTSESWILKLFFLDRFYISHRKARIFEGIAMFLETGRSLPESLRLTEKKLSLSPAEACLGRIADAIDQGQDARGCFSLSTHLSDLAFLDGLDNAQQHIGVFQNAAVQELKNAKGLLFTLEILGEIAGIILAAGFVALSGLAFFIPYFNFIAAAW